MTGPRHLAYAKGMVKVMPAMADDILPPIEGRNFLIMVKDADRDTWRELGHRATKEAADLDAVMLEQSFQAVGERGAVDSHERLRKTAEELAEANGRLKTAREWWAKIQREEWKPTKLPSSSTASLSPRTSATSVPAKVGCS